MQFIIYSTIREMFILTQLSVGSAFVDGVIVLNYQQMHCRKATLYLKSMDFCNFA